MKAFLCSLQNCPSFLHMSPQNGANSTVLFIVVFYDANSIQCLLNFLSRYSTVGFIISFHSVKYKC